MVLIEINGTNAVVRKSAILTKGLVGATVAFRFDENWDGLSKTAVFRQGNVVKDCLLADGTAVIPWEVMQIIGIPVSVGVYGTNADGTVVIPTIWAKTDPVRDGADPSGDESIEPAPGVWEQMQAQIDGVKNMIPTVPTKVSAFENDKGYLTAHQDLSAYAKKADVPTDAHINSLVEAKNLVKTVNGIAPDEDGNVKLQDKAAYVEDFKTDSNKWDEAFAELVEYCKTNNCVARTGGGKYTLSAPLYIGDIDVDFENSELVNNTEKAEGTADYACVILTGAEKRVQKFGTVTGRGSIGILVNTETGKYKFNRLYAKLVQGKLGALHIVTTNYTACFNEFHVPLLKSAWVPLRVYCESTQTKWANECHFYLAAIESYRLSEFDYPRKLIEMTKASRCNIYNVDLECGKMERTLSDGTVIPADPNHTTAVELRNCSDIAFYNPRTKEPYNAVQFRFIDGCTDIFIDGEYSKFNTIDCSQKIQDDVHYSVWRGRAITGNSGCNTNAKNLRIYKDLIVPEILTPMTREVADGIIVTDDLIGDWKNVNGYPMGGIPTLIKWSGGDVTLDKRFIALLPTTIQIMRTSEDVGDILDTDGNVIVPGSVLKKNKLYDILVDSVTYALGEPTGELGRELPYLADIRLSVGIEKERITPLTIPGFVRFNLANPSVSPTSSYRHSEPIPMTDDDIRYELNSYVLLDEALENPEEHEFTGYIPGIVFMSGTDLLNDGVGVVCLTNKNGTVKFSENSYHGAWAYQISISAKEARELFPSATHVMMQLSGDYADPDNEDSTDTLNKVIPSKVRALGDGHAYIYRDNA